MCWITLVSTCGAGKRCFYKQLSCLGTHVESRSNAKNGACTALAATHMVLDSGACRLLGDNHSDSECCTG